MPAWGVVFIAVLSFIFQGGALDVASKIGADRKRIPAWWIHRALRVAALSGWLVVLVGLVLSRLHAGVGATSSGGLGQTGPWNTAWSTVGWLMAAGFGMLDWLWLRAHLHRIRCDAANIRNAQAASSRKDVVPPVAH